ncbi:hypothetical protein EV368DRAFT_88560 [Lentinula lateritia]|nr:hypothetical protein EV368DRAFT_88560 [Lentinula lateritia]
MIPQAWHSSPGLVHSLNLVRRASGFTWSSWVSDTVATSNGAVLRRAGSDDGWEHVTSIDSPKTSSHPQAALPILPLQKSRAQHPTPAWKQTPAKESNKIILYTFLDLEYRDGVRDGGGTIREAEKLVKQLIMRHIPSGNFPEMKPTNKFVGVLEDVQFEVDLGAYGSGGKCRGELNIVWSRGRIPDDWEEQTRATWTDKNGEVATETYLRRE